MPIYLEDDEEESTAENDTSSQQSSPREPTLPRFVRFGNEDDGERMGGFDNSSRFQFFDFTPTFQQQQQDDDEIPSAGF